MMLTALNAITTKHANPTTKTLQKTKHFLDYMAMSHKAIITYHVSDDFNSYSLYLSKPRACSRVGRHFLMSTNIIFPPTMDSSIQQKFSNI